MLLCQIGKMKGVLIALNYFGCHAIFLLYVLLLQDLDYVFIGASGPRWGGKNEERMST